MKFAPEIDPIAAVLFIRKMNITFM